MGENTLPLDDLIDMLQMEDRLMPCSIKGSNTIEYVQKLLLSLLTILLTTPSADSAVRRLGEDYQQLPERRQQSFVDLKEDLRRSSDDDSDVLMRKYTAAIVQYPQAASLYAARASLYSQWNQHEKALADLSKATSLDRWNTDYVRSYVEALKKLKRYDEALRTLDRHHRHGGADQHVLMAELYLEMHETAKALEEVKAELYHRACLGMPSEPIVSEFHALNIDLSQPPKPHAFQSERVFQLIADLQTLSNPPSLTQLLHYTKTPLTEIVASAGQSTKAGSDGLWTISASTHNRQVATVAVTLNVDECTLNVEQIKTKFGVHNLTLDTPGMLMYREGDRIVQFTFNDNGFKPLQDIAFSWHNPKDTVPGELPASCLPSDLLISWIAAIDQAPKPIPLGTLEKILGRSLNRLEGQHLPMWTIQDSIHGQKIRSTGPYIVLFAPEGTPWSADCLRIEPGRCKITRQQIEQRFGPTELIDSSKDYRVNSGELHYSVHRPYGSISFVYRSLEPDNLWQVLFWWQMPKRFSCLEDYDFHRTPQFLIAEARDSVVKGRYKQAWGAAHLALDRGAKQYGGETSHEEYKAIRGIFALVYEREGKHEIAGFVRTVPCDVLRKALLCADNGLYGWELPKLSEFEEGDWIIVRCPESNIYRIDRSYKLNSMGQPSLEIQSNSPNYERCRHYFGEINSCDGIKVKRLPADLYDDEYFRPWPY